MSNISFSPIKHLNKSKPSNIICRPFSSIVPRSSFKISNPNNNSQLTNRMSIKYILENNFYSSYNTKSTKVSNTRNNYNKIQNSDLIGKEKYSNFTLFIKREMSQKNIKITPKNIIKKLTRQNSSVILNPQKIFREGNLYLTDIISKKHRKTSTKNLLNYAPLHSKSKNFLTHRILKNFNHNNSSLESNIINNHKYKNINLLRKIESEKNILKKKSFNFEEEKNNYLINKKSEYISIKEKNTKMLYNYMNNLKEYIKYTYSKKLNEENYKINCEEVKNNKQYINDKLNWLQNSNKLYNDLFLNKFNDYVKFLTKKVDQYDKCNYDLLNEATILKKQVGKLKKRINILLEEKKMYNKFILLQIRLKKKTMKIPDYYEFILNHNLEEGIEHCKDILDKKEVKEIYGYKKKIIYQNYDNFKYQFKTYENENRDLLVKLGTMKKEINKLNENKNELIEEGNQIANYLKIKTIEKTQEKINIINKYNLLMNEKNNLLKEIGTNFSNINQEVQKPKNKNRINYEENYGTNYPTKYKSTNTNTNIISINKSRIKGKKILKNNNNIINDYTQRYNSTKNYSNSTKDKQHLSKDEQIFSKLNIIYEAKNKDSLHSELYLKVRKLFFLLKNFMNKDEYFIKAEKISTENGLIIKLLGRIEDGMNNFIENERAFDEKNKEIINKMKQKIERQRKIIKGQKHKQKMKAKNENMKRKVEEKAKKIYFLPKNRKRAISANLNKKSKKRKLKKKVVKSEYELLVEYFKEN